MMLSKSIEMKKNNHRMSIFTFLRMCLGGAIAGIALTGIISGFLGIDLSNLKDIIGATVGVSGVALLKFAHVI